LLCNNLKHSRLLCFRSSLPGRARSATLSAALSQGHAGWAVARSAFADYSEHLPRRGRLLFEKVGELGAEGIVSKRLDAPYTSGPSSTWLKTNSNVGLFPVIGYVPDGTRIEALLVAEDVGARLRPVGRIEFRRPGVLDGDAHEALLFLTRPKPCIPSLRPSRHMRWVEPRLIAEVKHFGRTGNGADSWASPRDRWQRPCGTLLARSF
jgi:ATP-dependent DNA ligase